MSKKLTTLFSIALMSLFGLVAVGQNITVNNAAPYNNPVWLVQNVLVDVSTSVLPAYNPPFSGIPLNQPNSIQVGYFDATGTNFPLDSGIVMTTAGINVAVPGTAYTNPSTATPDSDLDGVLSTLGLSASTLWDKAVIEFSFVAVSDSIEFEYIFASNEYSGYTCSNFNDVFGFFITGHGINGNPTLSTQNIAKIPNSNVPVAINTLNSGSPSGAYPASNCLNANPNYVAHSQYFVNNPSLNAINFNGYTQVLKAKAAVLCGNVYHIKLAICDVSDGILNSGVFLGAKSFRVPRYTFTPVPNATNSFQDTMAVEGCSATPIVIEKVAGLIGKDVGVSISTSGTAIEGVDYLPIVDSIWMPSSMNRDTIYIHPINDGITEPAEKVELNFDLYLSNCPVVPTSTEIYIRDKTPITSAVVNVTGTDSLQCHNDSIHLRVDITGGDGDTLWGWSDLTMLNVADRFVSPEVDTTYYIWITDECRTDTLWDSVRIHAPVVQPLVINTQQHMVCDGESVTIVADFGGGEPPYDILWFNGSTLDSIEVTPRLDTNWVTYGVTDACGEIAFDSILVHLDTGTVPNFSHDIDFGDPLNVVFQSDHITRLSYYWDFGDGDTSTQRNPSHLFEEGGTYLVTLTIMTSDSCVKQVTRSVEVEEIYELYIPNAFTPNGDNLNETFAIQGTGIEKYEIRIFNRWGTSVFHSDDITKPWDGTFNGQAVPQGVYSYTIYVTTTFGGLRHRKGTLNLFY